ncbi:hypothetical protein JCM10450v2_006801 [Rhodotorula kratochvilovae]
MDQEILISSSSSTEARTTPPLLQLPNELLDKILKLAYEDELEEEEPDEPSSKPICRRLYPIQQRYIYQGVRLKSCEARNTFADDAPAHGNLGGYPALSELTLSLNRHVLPGPDLDIVLPNIRTLHLQGHGSVFGMTLPDLGLMFPNLEALSLKQAEGLPELRRPLSTVVSSLRRLVLDPDYQVDGWDTDEYAIDDCLSRFDRLEHLEMGEALFVPARLLRYVQTTSSLTSLAFGTGSILPDDFLLELVTSPTRPPQLAHLRLDHIYVRREPTLADVLSRNAPGWSISRVLQTAWCAPQWLPRCTEEGLARAVAAARKEGAVEVTGDSLNALGWREAYDREMAECAAYRAEEQAELAAWEAQAYSP